MYMFSKPTAFIEENDIDAEVNDQTLPSIIEHLKNLDSELAHYFPQLPEVPFALAISSFTVDINEVPEEKQEEFIELINSDVVKSKLASMSISQSGSDIASVSHSE